MEKYELWGYEENIGQDLIGGPFVPHPKWELVAVFSSIDLAEEYVNKSKLKTHKRRTYSGDKVFKSRSLLSSYQDYEIRDCSEPPLDPKI